MQQALNGLKKRGYMEQGGAASRHQMSFVTREQTNVEQ